MYYERYMNDMVMSSGWASDAEIAASRGCVEAAWDSRPEEGGIVLFNHDGRMLTDGGSECRHVLVVGATGTGKSRLVMMPSLLHSLRAEQRRSFVVFDVKGELAAVSRKAAEENGYDVLDINFRMPGEGNMWNPFHRANELFNAGDKGKAWKLVEDIVDTVFVDSPGSRVDPFWCKTSADLFRGICSVIWNSGQILSLKRILAFSNGIPVDSDDDCGCKLFMLAERNAEAARMIAGYKSAPRNTRGCILSSFKSYLSALTSRSDVLEMVSGATSVDFRSIGTKPTVLYITLPDDSTALGSLQGILITQLVQELNDCAIANGGCLPVRTEVFLDELCNIKPAIPSLETALTIARSRGIRYILAIQSYAQLEEVYGSAAETISANCSTWISFNVAKDETFREKLTRLCGRNAVGDLLITPSQLAMLDYDEAIVIRERCAPYFTLLEDISRVQERLNPVPVRCRRRRASSAADNIVPDAV